MKKLWTDPNEIHIVEILNNRELNTDYVGSLAESMERNGFLTEYPIEVFETAKIPSIQTSKPYICACGAHRTIAANVRRVRRSFVHYPRRGRGRLDRDDEPR